MLILLFFNYNKVMARIICVANSKGGVGKTTTSVNLGAYLANRGRKVLLIDFDPQANATSALGHDFQHPENFAKSVYHGILGIAPLEHIIQSSPMENYHYIPSHPDLAGLLVELVNYEEREFFLRKFLNHFRHSYDYILIDSPPSLSLLTINGLIAADEVLIPVQAEYYSLEGLSQLLQTIDLIRTNLNHPLAISGAVLTMYDRNQRLSREIGKNLRRHFPGKVFDVEIPRAVALAEAPSFGQTIHGYSPDSLGAHAYNRLAEEIIKLEDLYKLNHEEFGNFNITLRQ